ncbi:MAG TPA: hypothetical protein VF137_09625 [Candidatus Dormibacteraeota bacterium]
MRRFLVGLVALAAVACGPLNAASHPILAAALKLRFTPGETITYDLHLAQNLLSGGIPVKTDLTGTEVMKVLSVATDGTATLNVTTQITGGTVNGKPLPSSMAGQTHSIQMTIAPDGRVTAGGVTISGGLQSLGGTQLTSLLPPGKVKPGDKWTKDVSEAMPFGSGTLSIHTTNQFLRYETVAGVKYAVVSTTGKIPLNTTIDLSKLAALAGTSGSSALSGSATLAGTIDLNVTTWLNPTNGELHQMDDETTMNLTIEVPEVPTPIDLGGTQSLSLVRK